MLQPTKSGSVQVSIIILVLPGATRAYCNNSLLLGYFDKREYQKSGARNSVIHLNLTNKR